jgi:hypothetical protein
MVGAVTYGVTRLFGTGPAGPIVVSVALLVALVWALARIVTGRTVPVEA